MYQAEAVHNITLIRRYWIIFTYDMKNDLRRYRTERGYIALKEGHSKHNHQNLRKKKYQMH